jgi:two-component system cell cycle sensor histidine kinase/response regulator CckA
MDRAMGEVENRGVRHVAPIPGASAAEKRTDLPETILAAMSDGLVELDEKGTVLSLDEGAETMLGTRYADSKGRELTELIASGSAGSAFTQALSSCLAGKESAETKLEWSCPGGRSLNLRLLLVHVAEPPRVLIGLRRIGSQEGQGRRQTETGSLESLGLFAGGIAHDFNNLLLTVIGNTTLIKRDLPFDSPLQHRLGQIEQAAKRAAELTDQILAFAGRSSFRPEQIDLERLLVRALDELRPITREADVRLEIEKRPIKVQADSSQLRRLLANLIENAVEALPDPSGQVRLRAGEIEVDPVALELYYLGDQVAAGRYAFIEVVDNGGGMDAGTQVRVFEPFFSTKFAGRGLGLPAVLGIVRAHGGTLNIYSEPDRGTRVRVLLPLETGAGTHGRRPETVERDQGVVVVADDEPKVREVATVMLEQAGYRVVGARNGSEAVDLVARYAAEVKAVLLDMVMPTMNGEEALRTLRERGHSVPVILSSGLIDAAVLERLGVADRTRIRVLQKPFQRSELLDLLQEIAV